MRRKPRRSLTCLFFSAVIAFAGVESVSAEMETGALPSELDVIRMNLQAASFLDPLPFDEPFFITGRIPHSVRRVTISVEELPDSFVLIGKEPERIQAFENSVRAFIDSVLSNKPAFMAPSELEWLRQRLTQLLIEEADKGARWKFGKPGSYLPWHWGDRFERTERRLIAPDTILDTRMPPLGVSFRFTEMVNAVIEAQKLSDSRETTDILVREILSGAQSAVYTSATLTSMAQPPLQWHRLSENRAAPDTSAENNVSTLIWNRLENRGRRDRMFEAGFTDFMIQCRPLDPDRRYCFTIEVEKAVTTAEANVFKEAVKRKLRAMSGSQITEAGYLSFRTRIIEAFEEVFGTVCVAAPGALFDRNISSVEVHSYLSRFENSGEGWNTEKAIEEIAAKLQALALNGHVVSRIIVLDDTDANNYISADIGMIHAPDIKETSVSLGVNFYFKPINKDVPLQRRGGFFRRFALTLGITLQSIDDSRRTRENLFNNQALVLGAGYRISQYIRAGGGMLVFRERDPKTYPLTSKTEIAYTPYLSFSFDVNMAEHLKGFEKLFDFLKDKSDDM